MRGRFPIGGAEEYFKQSYQEDNGEDRLLAHIVRLESGSTRGWQVRLNLGNEASNRYESRLFSDRPCGGKRKAKAQAEAYLREVLDEQGIDFVPSGRRRGMMFAEDPERRLSSNRSGRTGVYRGEHARRRASGTQMVRYYAASYAIGPDGRRTNRAKRFSFGAERSEEEARSLAIEFREEWERAYLEGGVRGVKAFFKARRSR